MNELVVTDTEPGKVDSGQGFAWWMQAWQLFMRAPLLWIVLAVAMVVLLVILGAIPLLGQLAVPLLTPVLVAAWLLAAREVAAARTPTIEGIVAQVQARLTPLLILGAILLGAGIVMALIVGLLGFGAVVGGIASGAGESGTGIMAAIGVGLMALVLGLGMSVVIGIAFWFAPALVMLRDAAPVDAIKASVRGTLGNLPAFLLFGVVYLVAALVASIPMGLGWILLMPMMMLTMHASFEDVFGPGVTPGTPAGGVPANPPEPPAPPAA
ncbi:MAG: BPSS1780 family membrane protein [Burkholderiaceae bacterium]